MAIAADPERQEDMFTVAREVYETMANDAGLDLSERDFEEMLLHEEKMEEFYQKFKDASVLDTAGALERIRVSEEETRRMRAAIKQWDVSLQTLQPKNEEADAAADEEVAKDIRELLVTTPRLVPMIFPEAVKALEQSVQGLKEEFTTMQQGVADLEVRVREEARQTVDGWQLQERFNETVATIQKSVKVMENIRHAKEQEVIELQAEVGELKTELDRVQQELKTAQVTSTWYQQGASEKQSRLEELEIAYDKLTNEKRIQSQSIAKLQRELQETQKARDDLQTEKTNHVNSLEQVREELRTTTKSRDSYAADKVSLTTDLQSAQQELEAVKEAHDSLEAEKTTSATSLQDVQKQLRHAQQELELVKSARDELNV